MVDTATGSYVNSGGESSRDSRYVTTRITADGRDGYPVEPGRYRLVVSRACPWANFPATVLWRFRLASLGTQLVLWTACGLMFGALTDHSERRRARTPVPVGVE